MRGVAIPHILSTERAENSELPRRSTTKSMHCTLVLGDQYIAKVRGMATRVMCASLLGMRRIDPRNLKNSESLACPLVHSRDTREPPAGAAVRYWAARPGGGGSPWGERASF